MHAFELPADRVRLQVRHLAALGVVEREVGPIPAELHRGTATKPEEAAARLGGLLVERRRVEDGLLCLVHELLEDQVGPLVHLLLDLVGVGQGRVDLDLGGDPATHPEVVELGLDVGAPEPATTMGRR